MNIDSIVITIKVFTMNFLRRLGKLKAKQIRELVQMCIVELHRSGDRARTPHSFSQ